MIKLTFNPEIRVLNANHLSDQPMYLLSDCRRTLIHIQIVHQTKNLSHHLFVDMMVFCRVSCGIKRLANKTRYAIKINAHRLSRPVLILNPVAFNTCLTYFF